MNDWKEIFGSEHQNPRVSAQSAASAFPFRFDEYYFINPNKQNFNSPQSSQSLAAFPLRTLRSLRWKFRVTTNISVDINPKESLQEKLHSFYLINVQTPSLPEQKRIVAILDEAFESITKAKENAEMNLNNAKEIFDSYLNSITADKNSLGELVDITTGKLDSNAAIKDGKYPFFTCSREIFAIDNFAFDCEAILLAGNNAVGDFNVKHYKGKFNAYQRTYIITVNQKNLLLYRYLYFQLLKNLKEFKQMSVGAGTKFLKLGMIKDLQISLPSITEQQSIVSKLDSISQETKKLEAIYTKKLADLEELKKSILAKAFNGELTEASA